MRINLCHFPEVPHLFSAAFFSMKAMHAINNVKKKKTTTKNTTVYVYIKPRV